MRYKKLIDNIIESTIEETINRIYEEQMNTF